MNIEEFVNYYLQNYRHEVLLNPYNGLVEFAKVFQEKMMEKAVEAFVLPLDKEIWCNELDKFPELKEGEKVKLIIIKEDKN